MLDINNLYNDYVANALDLENLELSDNDFQYIENYLNKQKILQLPSRFKSIILNSDDEIVINAICRGMMILNSTIKDLKDLLKNDKFSGKKLNDEELYLLNNTINILNLPQNILKFIQNHKYYKFRKVSLLGDMTAEEEQRLFSFLSISPTYYNKIPNELISASSNYDIVSLIYGNINEKRHSKPIKLDSDNYRPKYRGYTHNGIDNGEYDKLYIIPKQLESNYPDLGKLSFLRNLLEYKRSGVWVNTEQEIGRVYHEDNSIEEQQSIELFQELYSEEWNEEQFRKNQSSFVGKPKNHLCRDKKLNVIKTSELVETTSDNVYFGFLLKGDTTNQLSYIHIVKTQNDYDYEIQFYILPNNIFNERLQVSRHDGFSVVVAHNNLDKQQVQTYSHSHVYNVLEMILGRKKGKYDISYNSASEPKSFDESLGECVEYNCVNSNEILTKIKEAIRNFERARSIIL